MVPFCGLLLFEEEIKTEIEGGRILRKTCPNPKCHFIISKHYGKIRAEIDWELIKSIPTVNRE